MQGTLLPTVLALSAFAIGADAAQADTDLVPGTYLRQTKRWDPDLRRFMNGTSPGEGEACFLVVSRDETEVTLRQVSGDFYEWWSGNTIGPGREDVWFDSDEFKAQNPGKPALTQIRTIFETVQSCQPTS
ncbi:hypothetical protein [Paracoccus pacificus]|uniref:Uncharacterized protein n=1 Tax=Paracoccus pacificus TaxID=1463598 RepID=A0ABW4R6Q0_9RHOB